MQASQHRRLRNYAFSLVEVSIILVILGLIAGGVLVGKALIRGGELRNFTSQSEGFVTSVFAFHDKYLATPGDMNNATQFWGFQGNVTAPGCVSSSSITVITTTGTCDGNGDNFFLTPAATAGATGERYQFWRQLALAGLLEGSYNGVAGSNGPYHHMLGKNSPATRINKGGWTVNTYGNTGSPIWFDGNYNVALIIGAATTNGGPNGVLLRPEEAWLIDTKMDDGKPGQGSVVAGNWSTCTTAANSADIAASYKTASSNIGCNLAFVENF